MLLLLVSDRRCAQSKKQQASSKFALGGSQINDWPGRYVDVDGQRAIGATSTRRYLLANEYMYLCARATTNKQTDKQKDRWPLFARKHTHTGQLSKLLACDAVAVRAQIVATH